MKIQNEQTNWYQNTLNLIKDEETKVIKFTGKLGCTREQRNELIKMFQNHKSLCALYLQEIMDTHLSIMVAEILSKNNKISTVIFDRISALNITDLFTNTAFKDVVNIEIQLMDSISIAELFTKIKSCCKKIRAIFINKTNHQVMLKVLEEIANGSNIDVLKISEFPHNFDEKTWLQALGKAKSIRHVYLPNNWSEKLTSVDQSTLPQVTFYEKNTNKQIILFPNKEKESDTINKRMTTTPTKEKASETSKKISAPKKIEASDEVTQLKTQIQFLKSENKSLKAELEEKTTQMSLLLGKMSPQHLLFPNTALTSTSNQIVKNSAVFTTPQPSPQPSIMPRPAAFQQAQTTHSVAALPPEVRYISGQVPDTKTTATLPVNMPPILNNSLPKNLPSSLHSMLPQKIVAVPIAQMTIPPRKTPAVTDLNEQDNKRQKLENGVNHLRPKSTANGATPSLVSPSEAQLIKNLSSKK